MLNKNIIAMNDNVKLVSERVDKGDVAEPNDIKLRVNTQEQRINTHNEALIKNASETDKLNQAVFVQQE
jgi:hypothetical protein